jgi:hypothetical protein
VSVQDVASQRFLLLGVHPGHGLVEQQKDRIQGQGPSELHQLLLSVGQVADGASADRLELEEVDDLFHPAAVPDLLSPLLAPVEAGGHHRAGHVHVPAQHQVVEHAHVLEQLDVLEGAGDPESSDPMRRQSVDAMGLPLRVLERDLAGLRSVHAGQAVEQAGLPRAIGADDGVQHPGFEVDREVVDGVHAPEAEGDTLDDDARRRRVRRHPGRVVRARGSTESLCRTDVARKRKPVLRCSCAKRGPLDTRTLRGGGAYAVAGVVRSAVAA